MFDDDSARLQRELGRARYQASMAEWRYRSLLRRRWWLLGRLVGTILRGPSRWRELPRVLRDLVKPPLPPARPDPAAFAVADSPKRLASSSRRDRVVWPSMEVRRGPVVRPDLRVAGLLDEFSAMALSPEADLLNVTRKGWREELDRHDPHLLFVESAWKGAGSSWRRQVSNDDGPGTELVALVKECKARGIPTVFWNKEDPPNFSRFIQSAALFDHVFTTAAECIDDYRRIVGHDRVAVLPFAAQPRIHHPFGELTSSRTGVAFAGTYYVTKHEDRRRQMDLLLNAAEEFDLRIYSRVTGDPKYTFPPHLARHVVGSLTYEQMLAAHQRHRVFLNVNSAPHSETMCSRRVFEVLAAGAAVVSTPSRAITLMLGEHVHEVNSPEEAREAIAGLTSDDEAFGRARLEAMRHVMSHHTYSDRMRTVLQTVGIADTSARRTLGLVLAPSDVHALRRMCGDLQAQTVKPDEVLILLPKDHDGVTDLTDLPNQRVERPGNVDAAALERAVAEMRTNLVGAWPGANRYGPSFLEDAANAFRMVSPAIVGKARVQRDAGPGALLVDEGDAAFGAEQAVEPATAVVDRAAYLSAGAGLFDRRRGPSAFARLREHADGVVSIHPHQFLRVPSSADVALGLSHAALSLRDVSSLPVADGRRAEVS